MHMHGYIYEYSSVHVEVRRGECGRQKELKSSYMAVRRWRFRFCWNPHFSDAWAQLSALHCSCNFFVVGRVERPGLIQGDIMKIIYMVFFGYTVTLIIN